MLLLDKILVTMASKWSQLFSQLLISAIKADHIDIVLQVNSVKS